MQHRLAFLVALGLAPPALGQCPEEPPVLYYQGAGQIACPCFISGEQAGVVFDAPSGDYPIEITKVRIGWGSVFGGAPQSLEQAIHIYPGGLPNPGTPQFTVSGPVLNDGFINEFDLQLLPGNRIVTGGPFTVALEFLNTNANMIFSPSVVHDGSGCIPGRNVVFAVPGGWSDACALGVTGNWVFEVVYRKAPAAVQQNGSGVNPLTLSSSSGPVLGAPWTVDLDCSAHVPGFGAFFLHTLPSSPIPTAFGEVLVDLTSPRLLLDVGSHAGGSVSFTNTPPLNPAFCGLELYGQGICLSNPGPRLSNRLFVRAGS